MNDQKRRSCATCRHNTPIADPIPSACADCIILGECTRWEDAGGKENEFDK